MGQGADAQKFSMSQALAAGIVFQAAFVISLLLLLGSELSKSYPRDTSIVSYCAKVGNIMDFITNQLPLL